MYRNQQLSPVCRPRLIHRINNYHLFAGRGLSIAVNNCHLIAGCGLFIAVNSYHLFAGRCLFIASFCIMI
jgi:hypothetical protein